MLLETILHLDAVYMQEESRHNDHLEPKTDRQKQHNQALLSCAESKEKYIWIVWIFYHLLYRMNLLSCNTTCKMSIHKEKLLYSETSWVGDHYGYW